MPWILISQSPLKTASIFLCDLTNFSGMQILFSIHSWGMRYRRQTSNSRYVIDISQKVNWVLNLILVGFVLIILRAWHLSVIQHDIKEEESKRPQKKVVVEPANRGTIIDRFGIPLAVNKIKYNVALVYSQMRQIPYTRWKLNEDGVKERTFPRREYIKKLAVNLGEELQLDPGRLEDLIHAKAAFAYSAPYVIKEDISEAEYYRLKMMEKDWVGIQVQRMPRRYYPQGKLAADVIGYMGAISREQYDVIFEEISALREYIKGIENGEETDPPKGIASTEEAKQRLQDLQEKAYTVYDYVGKTGIEGKFEESLRGFHGKHYYASDAKGNFLRKLPGGRDPASGNQIRLSISAELQAFAEKLLTQNERIREARTAVRGQNNSMIQVMKQPWIKGGAIVAMDPKSGEILALATYPRFDPNDFIPSGKIDATKQKRSQIQRWFETDSYIADVWNEKRPLEKEIYIDETDRFDEQRLPMTWDNYLKIILPENNPIRKAFAEVQTVRHAVIAQKKEGYPGLENDEYNRLLFLDLCKLIVPVERFSNELLYHIGNLTLNEYKSVSSAHTVLTFALKEMIRDLFREGEFAEWRTTNETLFLKEKRAWEQERKMYAKPYLDYLDQKEEELFAEFWETYRFAISQMLLTGKGGKVLPSNYEAFLKTWREELNAGAHHSIEWNSQFHKLQKIVSRIPVNFQIPFLQTLRSYQELDKPLLGRYKGLRNGGKQEKDLAASFYPKHGFGYGRSQGYRQAAHQGSIFKLVTAYEAIRQRIKKINPTRMWQLNPLNIVDRNFKDGKKTYVGYTSEGKVIPRVYKGGTLPRSVSNNLGEMDILKAIETSSNPYFAILAGDILESPEDLANAARAFGYGTKTGIDLPAEIPGRVPTDLMTNRTGLYATSIGQHSLVVTPLQTAVMLSSLTNGGKILKPQITLKGLKEPEIIRTLPMPKQLQKILLEGMRRVVVKTYQSSLLQLSKIYHDYPEAISDYIDLKEELLGKTSTSESLEQIDLDAFEGTNLYNHLWFGGISYEKEDPEIVVVVYLRFGGYGKEAAPVAAQVVKKWREIKGRKHFINSPSPM